MGYSNYAGGNADAKKIVDFLNSHPGYDPGWDAWKVGQSDVLGRLAKGEYAGVMDAYGGNWDASRGRAPGDEHGGSIQAMEDEILRQLGSQTGYSDIGILNGLPGQAGAGGTGGDVPRKGGPYMRYTGPDLFAGTGSGGGSYAMPTTGGWDQYLKNLGQYQAPEQGAMEDAYTDPAERAKAYILDMINKTGARQMLSSSYLNRLLKNATQPYMDYMVNAGAQGTLDAGNFGDFMKQWIGGNAGGYGPGVQARRGQVQQLLDKLRSTGPGGGQGSPLWDAWVGSAEGGQNPNLLMALISGLSGPFAQSQTSRMYSDYAQGKTPTGGTPLPGVAPDDAGDWIDFLMKEMGSALPYRWAGGL